MSLMHSDGWTYCLSTFSPFCASNNTGIGIFFLVYFCYISYYPLKVVPTATDIYWITEYCIKSVSNVIYFSFYSDSKISEIIPMNKLILPTSLRMTYLKISLLCHESSNSFHYAGEIMCNLCHWLFSPVGLRLNQSRK